MINKDELHYDIEKEQDRDYAKALVYEDYGDHATDGLFDELEAQYSHRSNFWNEIKIALNERITNEKALEEQKAREVNKENLQQALKQIGMVLDDSTGKYGMEIDELLTRRKSLIEEIKKETETMKDKEEEYDPEMPDYLGDELHYDIEEELRHCKIPEISNLLKDAKQIEKELDYRESREFFLPEYKKPRENFDELNASLEAIVNKYVKTQEKEIPSEPTKESEEKPLPVSENLSKKNGINLNDGFKSNANYLYPKENFRELIGEVNLRRIEKTDLERIDKSIDKRIAENNQPTVAEIKNLALRAVAKIEMNEDKAIFMQQTRENINKFVQHNPGTSFSKRQYSDIMKRAEKSMSPLEVSQDMYKISQVNNLTDSFIEQMKDNGITVSRRFQDLLAQKIEREQVSMTSIQSIMDKTIETTKLQNFHIKKVDMGDKNSNEKLPVQLTDFHADGVRKGSITISDDETFGSITAELNTGKPTKEGRNSVIIVDMTKNDKGFYTSNGLEMTKERAITFAEKSLTNAINTNRVIENFQVEVISYISGKELEKAVMETIDEMRQSKSKQITDTAKPIQNEKIAATAVKPEVKEQSKESPSKSVVEGPDL
jgi:hypothetical protein